MKFEVRDLKNLLPVMESFPFATVISVSEGKAFVSHLPMTPEINSDGKLSEVVGKFKLSQNRSLEDQQGVIQGLEKRTDDFSKAIRAMMLKSIE